MNDEAPKIRTIGEVLDELVEEQQLMNSDEPVLVGEWEYDKTTFTIEDKETGYYVNLDEMHNSASVLDWIIQLAEKHPDWMSDEKLGQFVRLLNRIFHLQSVACGGGVDKEFDPRSIAGRPQVSKSEE